ncbi:hypothetical protein ACX6VC_001755 [Enterobacter hormaechei]
MSKLRVWHIPQVPMKAFTVEVQSVEEGVRLMDALADEEMADMELTDRWVDWYSEYYDDPREYLESLKQGEPS